MLARTWLCTRSPFFDCVPNVVLCATVDIMSSSSSCFAILVLIEDSQGPPAEASRPVYICSEQMN